jgi:phosphatidylserine decarboxylase
VALIFLSLLALKWNIKLSVAIIGAVVIGLVAAGLTNLIAASFSGLHVAFLVIIELGFIGLITGLVLLLRFYRDPERSPPETGNVILSPADGKVIYINEVEKGSALVATKGKHKYELAEITSTDLLAGAVYLLGIDMNILNVHVNRTPVGGRVILRKRTRGSFISLRKQESEIVNERVTTVIDNDVFKIGVIQIASRLVRRINSYIGEKDEVTIGQRLGAIMFGSQVDVVIPSLDNLKIVVKSGDEVKAGLSIIARYGGGKKTRDIPGVK